MQTCKRPTIHNAKWHRLERWTRALLSQPLCRPRIGPDIHAAITDKAVAERMTQKIDLEWVIVRPVVLVDKPEKGRYTAGPSARVAPLIPLSFDDCADCMLRAATDEPTWIGKILNVGS
jgi:hypothetical protein